MIERGHVYLFSARRGQKRRPWLVVSPDSRNASGFIDRVIAIPFTRSRRRGVRWRVTFPKGAGGLPQGSDLACEQIAQVPKSLFPAQALGGPVPVFLFAQVEGCVSAAIGF